MCGQRIDEWDDKIVELAEKRRGKRRKERPRKTL
jgi:hypothetical protein